MLKSNVRMIRPVALLWTTQGPCIGVVYDIAIHQTMFINKHSFNFIQ